jgi:ribosomal protein L29
MKMKDFREMDAGSLTSRIAELRADLMQLRETVRAGKEKNHANIGQIRRELARALTLQRERKEQV